MLSDLHILAGDRVRLLRVRLPAPPPPPVSENCGACGFVVDPPNIEGALAGLPAAIADFAVAAHEMAESPPTERGRGPWPAVDYARHVRDHLVLVARRLEDVAAGATSEIPTDEVVRVRSTEAIEEVLVSLATAGAALGKAARLVPAGDRQRLVWVNTHLIPIPVAVQRAVHEVVHHGWDVRRLSAEEA